MRKALATVLSTMVIASSAMPIFGTTPEYKLHLGNVHGENGVLGAEYLITQTGGAYNPLTGQYEDANLAPFSIKIDGQPDTVGIPAGVTVVDNATTDKTSRVSITLPEGSYTVKQTKSPVEYYKVRKEIKFHLPRTTADGTGHENEINVGQKISPVLKNFSFKKTKNGTAETLDNAVFELFRYDNTTHGYKVAYDGEGNIDSFDVATGQENTDFPKYTEKGTEFTTNMGMININDLPTGIYYLQEKTAPDGYVRNPEKIAFKVYEESKDATGDGLGSKEVKLISKELTNHEQTSHTKKITNDVSKGETETNAYLTNAGQTVSYELRTKIPTNISEYKSFVIEDTAQTGLSFKQFDSIEIENVDQSGVFTFKTGQASKTVDGVADKANDEIFYIQFKSDDPSVSATANDKDISALAPFAGKELVIKYTMDVDSDVAADTLMKNTSKVLFHHPQLSGEKTDERFSKIPGNTIKILKVDGQSSDPLVGVKFELYKDEDGVDVLNPSNKVKAEAATGVGGVLEFTGLINGTYYIKETATLPGVGEEAGYRLLNKPIKVVLDNQTIDTVVVEKTVKNFKTNVFIPNTGTFGVLGFLAAGSGLILFAKKRKDVEEDVA